jgi:farnesyl diphosphate synthase
MSNSLQTYIEQRRQRINQLLHAQLSALPEHATRLKAAMLHGTLLGGKRLRPLLVYASGELFDAEQGSLDAAAKAVEYMHAYSLIHDDLPAMDDDDLRRGQPTCHVAFDEATAILAGDALQALAFETLLTSPSDASISIAMLQELADSAGYLGMCGGQAMDMAATDNQITVKQLQHIHTRKTGALIRCAVRLGAIAGGATDGEKEALSTYAEAIGLAFQVQDDILDVTSDTATLGKPQGSDVQLNKSTYPALLGLEGAKAEAIALIDTALKALSGLPYNTDILAEFAQFIIKREK